MNPPVGAAGSGAGGLAGGEGGTFGDPPSVECGAQLLRNSNFDAGKTEWVEKSTFAGLSPIVRRDDPNLVFEGVTPHSGDYLAWLGGITIVTDKDHFMSVAQDVAIPADAVEIVITGQLRIATLEEDSTPYDEGHIRFYDEEGVLVWPARTWSNLDATALWMPFEIRQSAPQKLAGKTLSFRIEANTDQRNATSFWFDSLRLDARCTP